MLDVVVVGRRPVGAERLHVRYHRARHAKAAVGVHVVRAEGAFEELREEVGRLGVQLAGAAIRDGVFVRLVDFGQAAGDERDRLVPGDAPRFAAAFVADHGMREAAVVVLERVLEVRALLAEHAEVGGGLFVSGDLRDLVVQDGGLDHAPNAAVRADRLASRFPTHLSAPTLRAPSRRAGRLSGDRRRSRQRLFYRLTLLRLRGR